MLATDIRQVREKLGIPSELKLADLRRTAWTEMANKGATVPELAASAGGQWTPQRRTWTPMSSLLAPLLMPVMDAGKKTKRDRKVEKVRNRWFFSFKKSEKWRE